MDQINPEQEMKKLHLDKSPGKDEPSVELYQTMWRLIRFDFVEIVKYIKTKSLVIPKEKE